MKLYTFCLYDYEGGQDYQFFHPEDKTREQFEADMQFLLVKYGDEYLEQLKENPGWAGNDEWTSAALAHAKELGYTQPEKVNVSTRSIWILSGDPNEKSWEKLVGPELHQKAVGYNEEFKAGVFDRHQEEDEDDED